jgi:23S rRNA (adenine2503-C2)-methyltransferase
MDRGILGSAHMPMLVDTIASKVDSTIKYVFKGAYGDVLETSFINKRDGKDIICVPSQTSCNLGCKFCFLTGLKLPVKNLRADEIEDVIIWTMGQMPKTGQKTLLISFMGCGEPLLNLREVIETCVNVRRQYTHRYNVVRFAIASLVPNLRYVMELSTLVQLHSLKLKFHLSLHSPFDDVRKFLMPGSSHAAAAVDAAESYAIQTENSAEIHYALIDGVNDRPVDGEKLVELLKGRNLSIKFLAYNERPDRKDLRRSKRVEELRKLMTDNGIANEYYDPPGSDVGSSCGQFLMDYYKKLEESLHG